MLTKPLQTSPPPFIPCVLSPIGILKFLKKTATLHPPNTHPTLYTVGIHMPTHDYYTPPIPIFSKMAWQPNGLFFLLQSLMINTPMHRCLNHTYSQTIIWSIHGQSKKTHYLTQPISLLPLQPMFHYKKLSLASTYSFMQINIILNNIQTIRHNRGV